MSDIEAVRRFLTPWKTRNGEVRYYVDDWIERILPSLKTYLVTHDSAPTIPELERAKVWYDDAAEAHVDYVDYQGAREFIATEMSKLFTNEDMLLPLFTTDGSEGPPTGRYPGSEGRCSPSNPNARSNIEAIRRYLKRYEAPDGSIRYYVNDWQQKVMPVMERYLHEDADEVTRRQFWNGKAYFDDSAELHIVGIQDEIAVEIIREYITRNYYLWGKDDTSNDIVLDFIDFLNRWRCARHDLLSSRRAYPPYVTSLGALYRVFPSKM